MSRAPKSQTKGRNKQTKTAMAYEIYDRLQESKRDDIPQHYGGILRYL